MIVVIFGNMVGDAFLSTMVVTREFGLTGDIWRNGPYIGGHLALYFKLNFKHVYNLQ